MSRTNTVRVQIGKRGRPLSDAAEMYNFAAKQWTILSNMECPRHDFFTCIIASKIFEIGGCDEDEEDTGKVYDETKIKWTKVMEGKFMHCFGTASVVARLRTDALEDKPK